jgi:hypothetical protein
VSVSPISVTKRKSGEYTVTWENSPVLVIRRDFYKGGWKIWNDGGVSFSNERFITKREAEDFIRDYVAP